MINSKIIDLFAIILISSEIKCEKNECSSCCNGELSIYCNTVEYKRKMSQLWEFTSIGDRRAIPQVRVGAFNDISWRFRVNGDIYIMCPERVTSDLQLSSLVISG
jgi:hypothetical protein